MAVRILIPYNFASSDEKSIDFVGTRYGGRDDVEITLFHAYPPIPDIDNRDSPVMDKVMLNTSYLRQQQAEQKRALESAKVRLTTYNIPMDRITCLYNPVQKDIAEDIIRLWKKDDFSVVVLSRNPGSIINYFSRSISKKIVRNASQSDTVHIVT